MNTHRELALHSIMDISTTVLTLNSRTEGIGSTQKTGDRIGRRPGGLALVLENYFILGTRIMIRSVMDAVFHSAKAWYLPYQLRDVSAGQNKTASIFRLSATIRISGTEG